MIKTTLSFFWNDKSNRYHAFSLKPLETFHEISMNVEGQDHTIFFFFALDNVLLSLFKTLHKKSTQDIEVVLAT